MLGRVVMLGLVVCQQPLIKRSVVQAENTAELQDVVLTHSHAHRSSLVLL